MGLLSYYAASMATEGRDQHDTTLEPDSAATTSAMDECLALTILHHPDTSRIGERALIRGSRGRLSRLVPGFGADKEPLGVKHMSRRPMFIEKTSAGVRLSVDADLVTARLDGAPCGDSHDVPRDALRPGVVLEFAGRVALLLHRTGAASGDDDLGLVGISDAIERVRASIRKVGPLGVTVFLRGPSGSGKELAARAIHTLSARKDAPFMSVNMAAVPETTAAATLFGHARGAFTGATHAAPGYFGRADGGTLFLDEIADTPSAVQPALLRVLESGEVQPLGEDTRQVDVRVIAATDADLDFAVAEGFFRQALIQRLEGYVIELPPLATRPEDAALLLLRFLREELTALGHAQRLDAPASDKRPWLPSWLVASAARASWPGNVRQLRNVARRLAIDFCDRDEIPKDPAVERLFDVAQPEHAKTRVEDIDEDALIASLRDHDWQPSTAAAALGISRTSIYALMKKSSRVRKAADLGAGEVRAALADHGDDVAKAARTLRVSQQGLKRRMHKLGLA